MSQLKMFKKIASAEVPVDSGEFLYSEGLNACVELCKEDLKYITISLDEKSVAEIKAAFDEGFKPVLTDDEMEADWVYWLVRYDYADIDAFDAEFNFAKKLCTIKKNEKLKVGVFGARRGFTMAAPAVLTEKCWISAVCDFDESTYEQISKCCCEDTKFFKAFDEFIDSGMDAVILANYFNEHAAFAIKALKKGIHVYSECIPAVTMAECVALCRAKEKSNAKYMLAENYAYFGTIMKMREIYNEKNLGEVVYSEGEYVHPMSKEEYAFYTPDMKHWRALMPSGYYLTHSLAPLMHVTGETPVAVNAISIYSDAVRQERDGEPIKDVAEIMLCTMGNGSVARITGWAKFAGHGNWYRFACGKGIIETIRGDDYTFRTAYNRWEKPEDVEDMPCVKSDYPFDKERASQSGHSGGDYYAVYEFLDCIQNDREPFFDVYRASAMSAVAILGWRSSLNDGKQYKIPDFKNEEERKAYENDNLTPFPDENGNVNFPCTKYQLKDFDVEF